MSDYLAYIRVSTVKQGEKGVSLQEQRSAIESYALRSGLTISEWLEERETAAKLGRPVFKRMMKTLAAGKARGVIIHKIDRSARNLRDWADLEDLAEAGVEIHFATERVDLTSHTGRLSADIQAVIAAHYIRNLREEVKKGMYGRLKQGLYPLPAPIGYLNNGKGQVKTVDPVRGPLVRLAFELYATGRYNRIALASEMYTRGLATAGGRRLGKNTMSFVLGNPFYYGLMRIRRTGETFEGIHQPLISKALYDRVQELLRRKSHAKAVRHSFAFRRLVRCENCGHCLTGERHGRLVYYRCHTRRCLGRAVRESEIERALCAKLEAVSFSDAELTYLRERFSALTFDSNALRLHRRQTLELQRGKIAERLERLTDAFLDGALEKEAFNERKRALLDERRALQEKADADAEGEAGRSSNVKALLDKAKNCLGLYQEGDSEARRELVELMSSKIVAGPRNVVVELHFPFQRVSDHPKGTCGAHRRASALSMRPLTGRHSDTAISPDTTVEHAWPELDQLIDELQQWALDNPYQCRRIVSYLSERS